MISRRTLLGASMALPLVGLSAPEAKVISTPHYRHVTIRTEWRRRRASRIVEPPYLWELNRALRMEAEADLEKALDAHKPERYTKIYWRKTPRSFLERDFETGDYVSWGAARFSWMYDPVKGDLREEVEHVVPYCDCVDWKPTHARSVRVFG